MDKIDKIRKARAAEDRPSPQGQPSQQGFHLSDDSKRAMESISAQMRSAQSSIAQSESPTAVIDESKVVDSAFDHMTSKPNLAIASIARRKEVESRCEDVRIDELFVSGELRQRVEIRPNRLNVTYRTLSSREDLYIKRRLNEVRDENLRYAEDRFLYMLLAAHVHTYNGRELPSILDENGDIKDALFDKRFKFICDLPQLIMEEIWVNFIWFEARVRRALEAENLSGG